MSHSKIVRVDAGPKNWRAIARTGERARLERSAAVVARPQAINTDMPPVVLRVADFTATERVQLPAKPPVKISKQTLGLAVAAVIALIMAFMSSGPKTAEPTPEAPPWAHETRSTAPAEASIARAPREERMSKSATASASKQPTEIAAQPATPTPAIGQPQPQPAVQAQLPRAQPGAPKAVATDVRPIEEAPPGEPVFPGPSLGPAASPSDYRGRDAFSLPEDAQSSPNFPSGDPRRAMNQGSPMYRSGTVEGPRTADQRGYQPQQAGVPYPATDRAMFEGNIVKPQAQPNYERTGSRTY